MYLIWNDDLDVIWMDDLDAMIWMLWGFKLGIG